MCIKYSFKFERFVELKIIITKNARRKVIYGKNKFCFALEREVFFFFFDRLEREVMGCQFAAFFRYNPKGKIYVSIKEI